MATKSAGLNAAGAVLMVVFGLVVLIGVIILMMWAQPDIQHSPSEQGTVRNRSISSGEGCHKTLRLSAPVPSRRDIHGSTA